MSDTEKNDNMLDTIVERNNTIQNDYGDPRINNWFLMSSPIPTLIMVLVYVLIVKKIGPWWMRHREPFEMRKTLIIYNCFQVILSTWLFHESLYLGWAFKIRTFNFGCMPFDTSTSPLAMRIVRGCWVFYFSKLIDFFDTFFFIMRKKYNQVSALHVIHHGIMPITVWTAVKITPGGFSTVVGLLNSFVHMIMYTYYMLAAIGPHMQKYLWWKKHLTLLQMVQFALFFVYAVNQLIEDCTDSPRIFIWLILIYSIMFFCLFFNFYRQEYKKEREQKAVAAMQKKMDVTDVGRIPTEKHPTNATATCSIPSSDTVDLSLLRNRAFGSCVESSTA